MQLGKTINTIPPRIRDGSVNLVREWRAARDKAARVAANSRSSAQELRTAINSMNRYV